MVGADINAKDIDGNTPCHFCSEYGHKDCLRYLLLKHPSLISKNKENQSPLDVAVNTEILQVSLSLVPDYHLDLLRVYNISQEYSTHLTNREEKTICHSERNISQWQQ